MSVFASHLMPNGLSLKTIVFEDGSAGAPFQLSFKRSAATVQPPILTRVTHVGGTSHGVHCPAVGNDGQRREDPLKVKKLSHLLDCG